MEQDAQVDDRGEKFTSLFVIGLVVVFVWAVFGFLPWVLFPTWQDRASFGEMFGAVNALFAGLAFAGILFALHLQRRELVVQREELQAQREELRLTRHELERTAEAQEGSKELLAGQVDALLLSARLSALTALVQNYGTKISSTKIHSKQDELKSKQLTYIDLVEAELQKLQIQKGK